MDRDKSGSCWLHEFKEACHTLGYSDNEEIEKLFMLLDIEETQQLIFESVSFLQCWEEEKKLDEFRERLGTRWVNKDPFMYVGDSTYRNRSPSKAQNASTPGILGLNQEDEDQLRRIFYICDQGDWLKGSGDHTISVDELEKATKMNPDVAEFLNLHSRDAVEKFFREIDSDEDGEVTWEEFKAYYIRLKIREKRDQAAAAAAKPSAGDTSTPNSKASPDKERKLQRSTTTKLASGKLALNDGMQGVVPDLGAPLEDWSAPATQDHKEAFLHFQRFLEQKFGTLSKAFDAMDSNDSGSLSLVEFQSVVGNLQYILPSGSVCRASDSKRLFLHVVSDGGSITWKEFGITPQQWIEHGHFKRRLLMAKKATSSQRHVLSLSDHINRTRNPTPKTELSFGLPLPKGWGFPPNFHPADSYFGRRRSSK